MKKLFKKPAPITFILIVLLLIITNPIIDSILCVLIIISSYFDYKYHRAEGRSFWDAAFFNIIISVLCLYVIGSNLIPLLQ